MRLKTSKTSIIMVIFVVLVALGLTVFVASLMKSKQKQIKLGTPSSAGEKSTEEGIATKPSSVKDALEKEKELLDQKGMAVGVAPKTQKDKGEGETYEKIEKEINLGAPQKSPGRSPSELAQGSQEYRGQGKDGKAYDDQQAGQRKEGKTGTGKDRRDREDELIKDAINKGPVMPGTASGVPGYSGQSGQQQSGQFRYGAGADAFGAREGTQGSPGREMPGQGSVPSNESWKLYSKQYTGAPGQDNSIKAKIWEIVYADKRGEGGFASEDKKTAQNKAVKAINTTKEKKNSGEKGSDREVPNLKYYVPYSARMDFSISTDSKASQGMPFVSTITEPGHFFKWKAIGVAQPDLSSNRFIVTINSLLTPDQEKYGVNGFAASVDESSGVITKVRRDEIMGILTLAGLGLAGKYFETMREDTTQTVVTETGMFQNQIKVKNRAKEALLAGAADGLEETKKQIEKTAIRLTPTLFLDKNTPVLLYFIK